MRDVYEEIRSMGAEAVAIGTGDVDYARRFVEEERIPYPVLVDDDKTAARAAGVRRGGAWNVLGPGTYSDSMQVRRAGHKIHFPGKRVFQLGATFVIGPGPHVRYEYLDARTTDHAPLDDVLAVLEKEGPGAQAAKR